MLHESCYMKCIQGGQSRPATSPREAMSAEPRIYFSHSLCYEGWQVSRPRTSASGIPPKIEFKHGSQLPLPRAGPNTMLSRLDKQRDVLSRLDKQRAHAGENVVPRCALSLDNVNPRRQVAATTPGLVLPKPIRHASAQPCTAHICEQWRRRRVQKNKRHCFAVEAPAPLPAGL